MNIPHSFRDGALALLAACAVSACNTSAPYSNDLTARSLETGGWSTQVGGIGTSETGGGYLRQDYGLSDSWDIGVHGEVGQLNSEAGVQTKYTFVESDRGWSVAAVGGMGAGRVDNDLVIKQIKTTGYYGYLGPIVSHRWDQFEAYGVARMNVAHYQNEIGSSFGGLKADPTNSERTTGYASFALGGTWWFHQGFGLTGNVGTLVAKEGVSPAIFVLGVDFRY